MIEGLVVEPSQLGDRSVGIRSGLEVGDEAVSPVALGEQGDAALDLRPHGGPGQPAIGAEAAVVAVDATADGDAAVHVGTGETGVDGDAVDAGAEALPQKAAEGIIAPSGWELRRH